MAALTLPWQVRHIWRFINTLYKKIARFFPYVFLWKRLVAMPRPLFTSVFSPSQSDNTWYNISKYIFFKSPHLSASHWHNWSSNTVWLWSIKKLFKQVKYQTSILKENICQRYCFVHALIATCQFWAWWHSTSEWWWSTGPAIIIATAPDSPTRSTRGAWTRVSKCEYGRTSSFLLPVALSYYAGASAFVQWVELQGISRWQQLVMTISASM